MALSAIDVIGPAFERTKEQLFRPFRFSQWLRLAVTGLLAGELGTAGGCNLQFPFNTSSRQGQEFQAIPPFSAIGPLAVLGIGLLVIAVLILAAVLLYISSRMRFVLFDSIVEKQCRIRQFWSRRGTPGFRLFIWQGLVSLASLMAILVAAGIPLGAAFALGWLAVPRDHILGLVLLAFAAVVAVLAAVITTVLVQSCTRDFVVPQMALENVTAFEGWRRLWLMLKQEKASYAGYIGLKIVLTIAAAVLFGILSLVIFLVLLLPVGGFGVLAALLARSIGLGWNPVTIATAIVLGGIVVLALIFVTAMISVPAIVFFPNYSMLYFAERYPALRAALSPGGES